MDHTFRERMTQTSFSIGFSIPGVFSFGFNYDSSKYSKSVSKIRRASGVVRLSLYQISEQPANLQRCVLGNIMFNHSLGDFHRCSLISRWTASFEPKRSWSWPSTSWSPTAWCFTRSSCSAFALCRRRTFMESTDRSTRTTAPTTSPRPPSEETSSTRPSWTKRS